MYMYIHRPAHVIHAFLLYIVDAEGVGAGAQCQTHDGEKKLSGNHACVVYMANGNDSRSKLYTYTYYTIEKLSGTHVHVICIWLIGMTVVVNSVHYYIYMGSGCFRTSGVPSELHVALCLNYITSRCRLMHACECMGFLRKLGVGTD